MHDYVDPVETRSPKTNSEARETGSLGTYLGIIEGVINRMASVSATIKGFAATILSGILAVLVAVDISNPLSKALVLVIALSCILLFFVFDWYYFYQEKRYRRKYNDVRLGDHSCDFDMVPPKYKEITPFSVLKSVGLLPYYGALEFIVVVAIVLCITGNM